MDHSSSRDPHSPLRHKTRQGRSDFDKFELLLLKFILRGWAADHVMRTTHERNRIWLLHQFHSRICWASFMTYNTLRRRACAATGTSTHYLDAAQCRTSKWGTRYVRSMNDE